MSHLAAKTNRGATPASDDLKRCTKCGEEKPRARSAATARGRTAALRTARPASRAGIKRTRSTWPPTTADEPGNQASPGPTYRKRKRQDPEFGLLLVACGVALIRAARPRLPPRGAAPETSGLASVGKGACRWQPFRRERAPCALVCFREVPSRRLGRHPSRRFCRLAWPEQLRESAPLRRTERCRQRVGATGAGRERPLAQAGAAAVSRRSSARRNRREACICE
jgi:hypothetical protein